MALVIGTDFNDYISPSTGLFEVPGYSTAGPDTIDGGAGADTMNGGDGNDVYLVDHALDIVWENYDDTHAGISDTVIASVSYTLGSGTTAETNGFGIENLTLSGTGNTKATGNQKNNVLKGNSGANVLDGGAGADTMNGGDGNDIYIVDNILDVVTENSDDAIGGASDTVWASVSYTLGSETTAGGNGFGIENLTLKGTADINATGNAKNNILIGNAGSNTLNGGVGADTMDGGDGNDFYSVDNPFDIVGENFDTSIAGTSDTVLASVSYTLGAGTSAGSNGFGIENITLVGNASINATGNAKGNVLSGNSGDNLLDGGAGADSMNGGAGNDIYVVDDALDFVGEGFDDLLSGTADTVLASVSYALGFGTSPGAQGFGIENLTLTGVANINATGSSRNNLLTGNSGANFLSGGSGNDTMDGGSGADTMNGGDGDDFYIVDSALDVVYEDLVDAYSGTDTVLAAFSYVLGSGTKTGYNGFGIENLSLTGNANIKATGNAANNFLRGNAGDNVLDGAGGIDTMNGGDGNDLYIVDNPSDVITENFDDVTAGASDTVWASVSYVLGSEIIAGFNGFGIENLTLTGIADIDATGNAKNNILIGNAGVNTLNGKGGADTMDGGDGNDLYYVDHPLDIVGEKSDTSIAGTSDTVLSWVSYTLGSGTTAGSNGFGIENLTLLGNSSNHLNATGNAKKNTLTGDSGNNILDGGASADVMNGGSGNDTYIVDDAFDIVGENFDDSLAGTADSVLASVSYVLGAGKTAGSNGFGIENLTLTGKADINATGNGKNNAITGNSGANILYSSLGNDTLNGGDGIDTANYSTVGAAVTFSAFGVLKKGSLGADTLMGIESIVGSTLLGDTIDLTAASTVSATTTDTNLSTGKVVINGTAAPLPLSLTVSGFESVIGSSLPDTMTGNGATNSLSGGAGNDTISAGDGDDVLTGGTGKDLLAGGIGNDKFIYPSVADSLLDTNDVIIDYSIGDFIDSPGTGALLRTSVGTVSKYASANISALLTPTTFPAKSCAAFNVLGFSGTFLALNDGTSGFDAATDGIVFLSGYSISSINAVNVV